MGGPDISCDPVLWVKRDKNKLVDALCNYTMDAGMSWSHSFQDAVDRLRHQPVSIVTFCDGGCRRGKCSGSAWAVTAGTLSGGTWTFSLVSAGGHFFDSPVSSFHAET